MEFPKDIAPTVKTVIESYPDRAQDYALSLRQLILKTAANDARIFVNCKTTLIQSFKDLFPEALNFEGTRAIWLDLNKPLPPDILSICIGKTLTYHLDKG